MSTNIYLSNRVVVMGSQDQVFIIDPKTSTILQQYKQSSQSPILFCSDPDVGYVLTCSPDKNFVTAFDYKATELWRQNLGGTTQLVAMFNFYDLVLGFHKNKEVRIWSQAFERKLELDFVGEVAIVTHNKKYVAIAEGISQCIPCYNQILLEIHLFFIEDLIMGLNDNLEINSSLVKPFKTLTGNMDKINDIAFGFEQHNILLSVCKNKQYLGWNFNFEESKPIVSGVLDGVPLCLTADTTDQYIFVGCADKNIYQVQISDKSQLYAAFYNENDLSPEFRIEKDSQRRRVLTGHLYEVVALHFYIEEGNGILLSGSADGSYYDLMLGQLLFWNIFDAKTRSLQPTIQKKIISLTTKSISKIIMINRPQEFSYESDESTFFRFKRQFNIKPLKKSSQEQKTQTNYNLNNSVILHILNSKKIQKELKQKIKETLLSIKYEIPVVDQTPQINDQSLEKHIEELIDENLKLKQINIALFNRTQGLY